MRVLAIADLHGDLKSAWDAVDAACPDVLVCCGDWGDPGEVEFYDLEPFTRRLPVYTVFGNHDNLPALEAWWNADGSPVLLRPGEIQPVGSLVLAGINGIWAKSHHKPFYVTDDEVHQAALRLQRSGKAVDILVSHGCPSGVADLTWQNRHGGQRCFLEAFELVRPRVYLTGHLHRPQDYRTKDGRIVRNVGETPRGHATLILAEASGWEVAAFEFR